MLKKILPLTNIVVLRFLGLFIVLPVISLYANSFEEASALMIGLVVGGAYLTQLIFQTPFGILSDKYDRKKVVLVGLVVFMLGSLVCAFAKSIEMLVLGRLLQGIGAVGGVVSAQIADMVKEEERTKAMAIMGGGIFASFTLAMIVGPLIGGHVGVNWLFFITAFLTLLSIGMLYFMVPSSPRLSYSFDKSKMSFSQGFLDKNLWIMNLSSFLQKSLMTLFFVIVPLALVQDFGFMETDLWKIYIPGALLGILAMGPASILAEKYNKPKLVLFLGIGCFFLAYLFITLADEEKILWIFSLGVLLFFMGFASLEPIMQSLTSKYAKAHLRGTALGNFTTASYLGSFVGGMFGALLYHHLGLGYLAMLVVGVCILWGITIFFVQNPQKAKNLYLPLESLPSSSLAHLNDEAGVIEWYINESEKVLIIKYNSELVSERNILEKIQK